MIENAEVKKVESLQMTIDLKTHCNALRGSSGEQNFFFFFRNMILNILLSVQG
jgi:hypothetical protein